MRIVLVLCVVFVAASCGGGDDDDTFEPDTNGLVGPAWQLVSLSIDGIDQDLAGTTPTLRVDPDGDIGGTNGCNSYGGPISIDGDTVAVGDVFQTEIGCEPALSAVEQAFMTALVRVDRWVADDRSMTLSAADGSAVMSFRTPDPVVDRPLEGAWILDTIGDADVVSSIVAGTEPMLEIAGSALTGSTGCNSLSATVTTDADGTFVVRNLSFTEIGCGPDIASQEQMVLSILEDASGYEIEGEHLLISAGDSRFLRYTVVAD